MNKKNIYIFMIIILWVIIFSLLVFPFQKKDEEKGKSLDINSAFIQNLYQTIVPNKNSYILSQLYNNTELTNEYKLNVGIMNYIKKMKNTENNYLSSSDIEKSVKEILGENTTVTHQALMFMINGFCGYQYNDIKQRYEPFDGCGGIPHEYFYQKLIGAKEKEDRIILTEQSVYAFINRNESANNIYVYNNYQQEKLLDYIENEDGAFYEIDDEKYISMGSLYEYSFRQENGKYIFESFKKVN